MFPVTQVGDSKMTTPHEASKKGSGTTTPFVSGRQEG